MHAHTDVPIEGAANARAADPRHGLVISGNGRIEDWLAESTLWLTGAAASSPIEISGTFGSLSHQAQSLTVAMMLSALHAALGPSELPAFMAATANEFDDWLRPTRLNGSGPVTR